MKAQHRFVLVSMVSGIASGMVVAIALPYFAQYQMTANHPGSVSNTAGDAAAGRVDFYSSAPPTNLDKVDDTTATVRINSHPSAPPANRPIPRSRTLAQVDRAQLRQNQAQLQQLERRLNQLENTHNADNGAEATPEEARAATLNWWKETARWFEHEEVDTQWAAATMQLFASDMAGLADSSGFALMHTECRSTQCATVLKWPSYDEASLGFATLLHHSYQANCARHTLLPPPSEEEADQPYHMTIIFDCSAWREQG